MCVDCALGIQGYTTRDRHPVAPILAKQLTAPLGDLAREKRGLAQSLCPEWNQRAMRASGNRVFVDALPRCEEARYEIAILTRSGSNQPEHVVNLALPCTRNILCQSVVKNAMRILQAALVCSLLSNNVALACTCPPSHRCLGFSSKDGPVFRGTVIQVQDLPRTADTEVPSSRKARIQVNEAFSGIPAGVGEIEVWTDTGSCGAPFKAGDEYLVESLYRTTGWPARVVAP